MAGEPPVPATDVPPDVEPAARCSHCDRPFVSRRLRDLHAGEVHRDGLSEDERAAYERAREAERDDLFTYHINVVIALGLIYAVMVIGLMVLLSG